MPWCWKSYRDVADGWFLWWTQAISGSLTPVHPFPTIVLGIYVRPNIPSVGATLRTQPSEVTVLLLFLQSPLALHLRGSVSDFSWESPKVAKQWLDYCPHPMVEDGSSPLPCSRVQGKEGRTSRCFLSMGATKTCTHHFLSRALRWIRRNLGHMAAPDTRKAGKMQRVWVITKRRNGTGY